MFPDGLPDGTHLHSFETVLGPIIRDGASKAMGMKRAAKRFHDAQSFLCDVRRQIALLLDAAKKDARLDLYGHLELNVLKGPCGRSAAVPRQYLRDLSTETMNLRCLWDWYEHALPGLGGACRGCEKYEKTCTRRPFRKNL